MEYLAEFFVVHSDFSLTLLLINDFSLNQTNVYYICIHANSILFYAYREKLDSEVPQRKDVFNLTQIGLKKLEFHR